MRRRRERPATSGATVTAAGGEVPRPGGLASARARARLPAMAAVTTRRSCSLASGAEGSMASLQMTTRLPPPPPPGALLPRLSMVPLA